MKKTVIIAIFCFLLLGALPLGSFAQTEGEGIKISPLIYEKTVVPGEVRDESLKVTNIATYDKTLKLLVKDFKAEGEEGRAKLFEPGTEEGNYLSAWIIASTTTFRFKANEEQEIKFQVKVPANAGPGGYYGALVMGTIPGDVEVQSEDKGAGISIAEQTAALLLFRVAGEVEEEALIKDFKTDKQIYPTPANVEFLTRIENSGNVHVKPYGWIEVKNMFGETKQKIEFNKKLANVMPKTFRKYKNGWEAKTGFGRYTASIVLNYGVSTSQGGEGVSSLTTETVFWIIPWKIVVPIILSLLLLIIGMALLVKFYKNKAVKKALEEIKAAVGPEIDGKEITGAIKGPKSGGGFNAFLLAIFILAFILVISALVFFIFFA